MESSIEDLVSGGLSDFRVVSIRWENVGKDLVLVLEEPRLQAGASVLVTLRFGWVTNLRVRMDFGQYMGTPLILESSLSRIGGGRWVVCLEFSPAPEGDLAFECNEMTLLEAKPV